MDLLRQVEKVKDVGTTYITGTAHIIKDKTKEYVDGEWTEGSVTHRSPIRP